MEQMRGQQAPMSFAGGASEQNNLPDYENIDEVTHDVTALMSRMKTLTDFISGQNDLASSLGVEEKTELVEEQMQLQKKLLELKSKKQQMANLVNELQSMNLQAENNFDEANNDNNRSTMTPPPRNLIGDEYDRIPLEYLQNARQSAHTPSTRSGHSAAKNVNDREVLPSAAKFMHGDHAGLIHSRKFGKLIILFFQSNEMMIFLKKIFFKQSRQQKINFKKILIYL